MKQLPAIFRHLAIVLILYAVFAISPTHSVSVIPGLLRPKAFLFTLVPLATMVLVHGPSVLRKIFIERSAIHRRGLQARIVIYAVLVLIAQTSVCLRNLDNLENIGPNVGAALSLFFWLSLQSWYLALDRDVATP